MHSHTARAGRKTCQASFSDFGRGCAGLGLGGRLRAALGDADHGRTQHAVADLVTGLHDLDHRVVRHLGIGHFEHRLVEIRIEFLAVRLQFPDAVAFHGRMHGAFGQFDALQQGLQRLVGGGALLFRHVVERPAQIVGDAEHVTGKIGDRERPGVLDLAFGAPAQVLHVGGEPQQPVLHVGVFRLEIDDLLLDHQRFVVHGGLVVACILLVAVRPCGFLAGAGLCALFQDFVGGALQRIPVPGVGGCARDVFRRLFFVSHLMSSIFVWEFV